MIALPDNVAKLADQLDLTDVPYLEAGDVVEFRGAMFSVSTVESEALAKGEDAILAVDNASNRQFVVLKNILNTHEAQPVRSLRLNDNFGIGGRIYTIIGVKDGIWPNLNHLGTAISRDRRIADLAALLAQAKGTVERAPVTAMHLRLRIDELKKQLGSLDEDVAKATAVIPALESTLAAFERRKQVAEATAPDIAKLNKVVEQVKKLAAQQAGGKKLSAEELALLATLRSAVGIGGI